MMGIPINSIPLSSTSPELDHSRSPLVGKIPINEPIRSKRSLTALLAAEVLFLEGILAAQNSQKGGSKVKARKVARPVSNQIHTAVHGKYTSNMHTPAYPPAVKQDITIPTPVQTTTTRPISQLDPFVMLTAPNLSRQQNNKIEVSPQHEDAILNEGIKTPTKSGGKREAKQYKNHFFKYGEYELYNPIIIAQKPTEQTSKISPKPSANVQFNSERQARKRAPRYGAFELYQPSFVIIKQKEKRESKNQSRSLKKANARNTQKENTQSYPLTYFTTVQARKVHKNDHIVTKHGWRKNGKRNTKS